MNITVQKPSDNADVAAAGQERHRESQQPVRRGRGRPPKNREKVAKTQSEVAVNRRVRARRIVVDEDDEDEEMTEAPSANPVNNMEVNPEQEKDASSGRRSQTIEAEVNEGNREVPRTTRSNYKPVTKTGGASKRPALIKVEVDESVNPAVRRQRMRILLDEAANERRLPGKGKIHYCLLYCLVQYARTWTLQAVPRHILQAAIRADGSIVSTFFHTSLRTHNG